MASIAALSAKLTRTKDKMSVLKGQVAGIKADLAIAKEAARAKAKAK